jgi:PAS domain-containing protein
MPLSQFLESRCRDSQAELADARRMIDVLRQSEEKFRPILAKIPDVTSLGQYGRMTDLSPKAEGLFGYSSEGVRASGGDLWPGRVHPNDSGGRSESQHVRRAIPDSAQRWHLDLATRARDPYPQGEQPALRGWNFCDVTARKLAEEELRSKPVFLEAQANSTIDGILVVDERGQRILQNQRLAELFKNPL